MAFDLSSLSDQQLDWLEKACRICDYTCYIWKEAQQSAPAPAPTPSAGSSPPPAAPFGGYLGANYTDALVNVASYAAVMGLSVGIAQSLLTKYNRKKKLDKLAKEWKNVSDIAKLPSAQIEGTTFGQREKKKLEKIISEDTLSKESSLDADEQGLAGICQMLQIKEAAGENPVLDAFKTIVGPPVRGLVSGMRTIGIIPSQGADQEADLQSQPLSYGTLLLASAIGAFTAFRALGNAIGNKVIPEAHDWTKEKLIEAQREYNRVLGEYLAIRAKRKKDVDTILHQASFEMTDPVIQESAHQLAEAICQTLFDDSNTRIPEMIKQASLWSIITGPFQQMGQGISEMGQAIGNAASSGIETLTGKKDLPDQLSAVGNTLRDVAGSIFIVTGAGLLYTLARNIAKGYQQYKKEKTQYSLIRKQLIQDIKDLGIDDYQWSLDLPNAAALRLKYYKDTGKFDEMTEQDVQQAAKARRRNLV